MNAKRNPWLIAIFLMCLPSVACANDMTMILPVLSSPFLIGGIIGSIVIGIVAPKTKKKVLVSVLQFAIIGLIGGPCTFVLSLCTHYYDSRDADIAGSFTFGYVVLCVACLYSIYAIFWKKEKRPHAYTA